MVAGTVEREAAEALLDRGVSVPLLRWRLFGKTLTWRVTMKRPTLGAQIEMARIWRGMEVTVETAAGMTLQEQAAWMARHGKGLSLLVATTVLRGPMRRRILRPLLAWMVREYVPWDYQLGAVAMFERMCGTKAFMPIIYSMERMNPMIPRTSQGTQGS